MIAHENRTCQTENRYQMTQKLLTIGHHIIKPSTMNKAHTAQSAIK